MAGTIDHEIALGAVDDLQALPALGKLHAWVVTVDHKRLGIMYIAGGLLFFLIAGLQAAAIRAADAPPDSRRGNRRLHFESLLLTLLLARQ